MALKSALLVPMEDQGGSVFSTSKLILGLGLWLATPAWAGVDTDTDAADTDTDVVDTDVVDTDTAVADTDTDTADTDVVDTDRWG